MHNVSFHQKWYDIEYTDSDHRKMQFSEGYFVCVCHCILAAIKLKAIRERMISFMYDLCEKMEPMLLAGDDGWKTIFEKEIDHLFRHYDISLLSETELARFIRDIMLDCYHYFFEQRQVFDKQTRKFKTFKFPDCPAKDELRRLLIVPENYREFDMDPFEYEALSPEGKNDVLTEDLKRKTDFYEKITHKMIEARTLGQDIYSVQL